MDWNKTLNPLMYLAMVNPAEALGIYLTQKCDEWMVAERCLQTDAPAPFIFSDIIDDALIIIKKILRNEEVTYLREGRVLVAKLSEFQLAGYGLEFVPGNVQPQIGYYMVTSNKTVIMSGKIALPKHLTVQ